MCIRDSLVAGRSHAVIELRSSDLPRVSDVIQKSKDERSVGVALHEMSLMPVRDFIVADLAVDAGLLDDSIPVGERFWLPEVTKQQRFFSTPMAVSRAWGSRTVSGLPILSLKTHDYPGCLLYTSRCV